MKSHAVVCTNLEKWFGAGDRRFQVLRGLNLEIPISELAMLVGPSGCGKTTLISVIAGLLDATVGGLEVLGQNPVTMSSTEQIQSRRRNLPLCSAVFPGPRS